MLMVIRTYSSWVMNRKSGIHSLYLVDICTPWPGSIRKERRRPTAQVVRQFQSAAALTEMPDNLCDHADEQTKRGGWTSDLEVSRLNQGPEQ